MNCKNYDFTRHAVQQMFARSISADDVKEVIKHGEKVASYPEDRPYPSYLLLHVIKKRPIHVVLAIDIDSETCIIVTAYEPSREIWEDDFKTRKKE
ncbi:MAG: DUF4258 domain-containing protein [Balneolaceae bacterium]|nr:DUF4258 domain-containing protein [Balneolaceae bacterium]